MKVLSAGTIPVRKNGQIWEYLLLRVYSYWDFPKGELEEGEDPWTAALREMEEETGLSVVSTPFGKAYYETEPYGRGKIARYYIVLTDGEKDVILFPNPLTGIVEHHDYQWLSYEEARKLLVPRVQAVLDWAESLLSLTPK